MEHRGGRVGEITTAQIGVEPLLGVGIAVGRGRPGQARSGAGNSRGRPRRQHPAIAPQGRCRAPPRCPPCGRRPSAGVLRACVRGLRNVKWWCRFIGCRTRARLHAHDRQHIGVVGRERKRRELLDLHRRTERLEEAGDGGPPPSNMTPVGRLRRPVDVVGQHLEDGGDVAPSEGLVDTLNHLDVVVRAHRLLRSWAVVEELFAVGPALGSRSSEPSAAPARL